MLRNADGGGGVRFSVSTYLTCDTYLVCGERRQFVVQVRTEPLAQHRVVTLGVVELEPLGGRGGNEGAGVDGYL